jgi:hypothetical protein
MLLCVKGISVKMNFEGGDRKLQLVQPDLGENAQPLKIRVYHILLISK